MVLTICGIGRGSGAAVPAVRSRGGVRSESGKEQLRGVSGLLDSMGRRTRLLRSRGGVSVAAAAPAATMRGRATTVDWRRR